jgi:protein TonB
MLEPPMESAEPPREIVAPLPAPPLRRPARAVPAPAPMARPAAPTQAPAVAEAQAVAVVPTPPVAPSRAETDYVGALLGWLERYKEYPRQARLRRIEGTAIVRLAILADGRLGALSLAHSSGHAVLDEASLEMVRRAAPLPRPPGGAVDLDVPVVFAQGSR